MLTGCLFFLLRAVCSLGSAAAKKKEVRLVLCVELYLQPHKVFYVKWGGRNDLAAIALGWLSRYCEELPAYDIKISRM
jgi:hypothetical protein